MDKDFLIYVFYIGLIVVILTAVFLISIFYKRKNTNKRNKKSPPASKKIENGNVSVFFDSSNNVTVIAYAKDKYGVGRAVEAPQFLNAPYSPEKLGEIIRKSMSLCKNGLPCPSSELMKKLDFKDWKEFSKNRRNISIYYRQETGIVINTTTRRSDGSYQFNSRTYDVALKEDVSDVELGNILIKLLPRCRA
jgi:hypothetical protein